MKRLLVITAAAVMSSSVASAADYYASLSGLYGKGGYKHIISANKTSNTKPKGFDVAVGTHITPETRAELAVGYLTGSISGDGTVDGFNMSEKLKHQTYSFMLNGYYDFNNSSAFTPYLMGGLGYAHSKHTLTMSVPNNTSLNKKASGHKGGFQYQLGLGVDVKAADNVKLGLGYRFRHDLTKLGIFKQKPSHLAVAQVRFEF